MEAVPLSFRPAGNNDTGIMQVIDSTTKEQTVKTPNQTEFLVKVFIKSCTIKKSRSFLNDSCDFCPAFLFQYRV